MTMLSSETVSKILQILLLILLQEMSIDCQFNLFNTDRRLKEISLEYDCLNYRVRNEELAYQDLFHIIEDTIPYCFRPAEQKERIDFNSTDQINRNLTFEELRIENITTDDLLLWSAPIDVVEDYQYYLNEMNSSYSMLRYLNCTKPWFGIQCEYSFQFNEHFSIDQIIQQQFSQKKIDSDGLLSVPCYIHIECDRGGSSLCLDWREICDGHVDCLNDGIDELNCIEMEINECDEDEYRCHNGLCIPEEYSNDGMNEGDCLDRSDEIPDVFYLNNCDKDPRFRCEEHSCRSNWHEFSCGDGQCVQKFDQCNNGRHLLLRKSLTIQKDLSKQCWILMVCLTKLLDEIDGKSCEYWLNDHSFLETCEDPLIEFPRIPIHRDHIRFLYKKSSLKLNESSFIYPDYICYDDELCDCIHPTFVYQNLTCVDRSSMELDMSISGHRWIDIIHQLNFYFSSCLITNFSIEIYGNSSSIYSCENSLKSISKSRIADETKDCCFGDDENTSLSCSFNDKHRIQCPNHNLCLSPINSLEDCPDFLDRHSPKIPFENYCDGIEEYSYKDPTGHLYTDESNCHHWPCNNLYSRCDGFWRCPNGEDEENCSEIVCPSGTHPCVTFGNFSLICLSKERVGDDVIDCLGASDEPYFCRELYPLKRDYERFRCVESDLCLSRWDLCDRIESCPEGEDEKFCENFPLECEDHRGLNQSLTEKILCQSSEFSRSRKIHFSLQTSTIYPLSQSSPIDWPIPQSESKEISIESRMTDPLTWNCHRGLVIRIWSPNETLRYGCLCPPSYYGDSCEYQNERISITLGLIRPRKDQIYTIILMLIDENDFNQILHSFDQFDYKPIESCSMKFNRYLLYPTRPKNISKTYHLRIDIYEKRTMTYRSSWDLSIPFLFLPVNRLIIRLDIPSSSERCLLKCNHGECLKYVNKAKEFCRCFPGWSGIECSIPIDCQSCSLDSICIGRMKYRSICICPLMKFGTRCLLSSRCPENACENNGQCITEDFSNDFHCICLEGFFGSKCQFIQSRLDVSIENLDIPGYLIAFFFTISEESKPRSTVLIEKLTLFQHVVTFHLSIPYHLVIIKSNERFYLAVVQPTPQLTLSTSINPTRECFSIKNLFNSTILNLPQFERMKYVHLLCQLNIHLTCFIDEDSICLCTNDHQANCLEFDRSKNFSCSSKDFCANSGECFEDHPQCPSSRICVCQKCFFGDQCQFYAKGFGLTLDQLLAYEIRSNLFFFKQNFSVKLTGGITMLMFIIGLINGICSILTFKNKISQEVGCGMYLLASSITSLFIVILFTMKFWFLLLSYSDWFGQEFLRYFNCIIIEPLLKILLYTDNWYNGCIAIERAFAVFKGIYFNKNQSKLIAKWMIWVILLGNVVLLIPQWLFLQLFHDEKEGRMWCVVLYSSKLDFYNSFLMIGHFFTPFFLNFSSAIFIIIETARQRVTTQKKQIYSKEFQNKLKQHKHLLLSPILLILLSLPRLIITFQLNCQKSFEHFWLYLFGYFVSFIPAVLVFVIFVLPSVVFKKAFKQAILRTRRRLSVFKMKFYFNKHL